MADRQTKRQDATPCAHDACKCDARPGEQYCSDHCAKAAQTQGGGALLGEKPPSAACQCGHPACA